MGVERKGAPAWEIRDNLRELAQLSETAGAEVLGEAYQKLDSPIARTYIGKGKAEEIAETCKALEIDTVIFDDELSPAQGRSLEKTLECKVLDRTALILDIFAMRAQTREGKLQIELAQLKHLLPRLTRFWTHLSRQKGGIGMRGDGETQLETDRRRILERMDRLSKDLETVRKQRQTQRQGRLRNLWPLASLVGYTNAGKSTLFNTLTGADVYEEDQLFATLDPTTRRLRLETNQNVLLSDTVGFIRKLPHQLVEAFKATLEEVREADLLLHVIDGSHPEVDRQIDAVHAVLQEIGVADKPTLMVCNKVDLVENPEGLHDLLERHRPAVPISARMGTGLDLLATELGRLLRPIREQVRLIIPHHLSAVAARVHEVGQVLNKEFLEDGIHILANLPPQVRSEFSQFIQETP